MPTRRAAAGPATAREWIAFAEERFRRAKLRYGHGTENPLDEAAWLVRSVAGLDAGKLRASLDLPLDKAKQRRVSRLVEERIRTRAPLAYILNEAWLGDLRFFVDRRVIVPRSHIAQLLRVGLRPWIDARRPVRRALDMCTGSGCLAILVALTFRKARVDAVDVSDAALAVAKRNIRDYGLARRVRPLKSNLFVDLSPAQYDLIVANPPYVDARSMARLPSEYRREPALALAGGADGLDFVRRILDSSRRFLSPKGLLVVEIGAHRKRLERAFPKTPFGWPETGPGDSAVFVLTREELPDA